MIAVGVADEDMADRAAGYGTQERRLMRFVDGAWIDQRQRIFANQVGVRAVKGEGARIVDGDTLDIRRNIDGFAIMRRKYRCRKRGSLIGIYLLCGFRRIAVRHNPQYTFFMTW